MIRPQSPHLVPEDPDTDFTPLKPKQPYLAAVRSISEYVEHVEAFFDEHGRVRTLSTIDPEGLFAEGKANTNEELAYKFLDTDDIVKALGLQHAELVQTACFELPLLGKGVEFRQMLTIDGQSHQVRGGYVHVYIDKSGKIFQVNSTVRHGRKPLYISKLISREKAIASAQAVLGVKTVSKSSAKLVFSAHNERMDPVYEVTLTTHEPRKVVLFLVRASNGQVLHKANKLRTAKRNIRRDTQERKRRRQSAELYGARPTVAAVPVPAKTLLQIPDPNVAISKQVHDALLDMLPNPKVLKNKNCTIYIGSTRLEVKAKSDGTFNYKPGEPEFSAVITFFAFNAQMELFKIWGMTPPVSPIPIFVNDPGVSDNAYFDPEAYEIHLGVGSGLPMGLDVNIAYDIGVTWHENGHHVVYLQTPGNDLPGQEGGAIHESIGDVLGDLLMDFWFRMEYGTQLGHTLTSKDVEDDSRVIGKFALPPDGIRIQKNTKKTPGDKTGEPHDDGLISGGAKADLLVAMVQKATDVKTALTQFGQLTLAALALVPAHKVSFQDLLKAYKTADQKLFNSANTSLITKCFSDHGIVLKGARTARLPPIIISK